MNYRKNVQKTRKNLPHKEHSPVKRGDIYYADLGATTGSEQGGERPVLIIQNNVGNLYSPTVIIAAITSRNKKSSIPTHIELQEKDYGLTKNSTILLEQIRTIDRTRLKYKMGHLDEKMMEEVNKTIFISLGIANEPPNQKPQEITENSPENLINMNEKSKKKTEEIKPKTTGMRKHKGELPQDNSEIKNESVKKLESAMLKMFREFNKKQQILRQKERKNKINMPEK